MRIVHLQPYYDPEIMYQESALPLAQSRLGHEVIIIASNKRPRNRALSCMGDRDAGISINREEGLVVFRIEPKVNIAKHSMPLIFGVSKLLDSIVPDVVFVHSISNLSLLVPGVAYCKKNRKAFFPISHVANHNVSVNHSFSSRIFYTLLRVYFRTVRSSITKLLAIAEEEEDFTRKLLGFSEEQTDILRIGGWVSDPSNVLKNRIIYRRKLGLSDHDFVFGHVSRINSTKGVPEALKVFSSLPGDELRFVVVGPIERAFRDGNELASIINKYSARDKRIVVLDRFLDHQVAMRFASAIDVGVYYGGVTIAARELMCLGIPIIVKPLKDWMHPYDFEAVLLAEDERSLADQMKIISNDDALLEKQRAKTLAYANEHLSWEKIAMYSIRLCNEYFPQLKVRNR